MQLGHIHTPQSVGEAVSDIQFNSEISASKCLGKIPAYRFTRKRFEDINSSSSRSVSAKNKVRLPSCAAAGTEAFLKVYLLVVTDPIPDPDARRRLFLLSNLMEMKIDLPDNEQEFSSEAVTGRTISVVLRILSYANGISPEQLRRSGPV